MHAAGRDDTVCKAAPTVALPERRSTRERIVIHVNTGPITPSEIKAVLERLRKNQDIDDSPLVRLRIVVKLQAEVDPSGRRIDLAWALREILQRSIHEELDSSRAARGARSAHRPTVTTAAALSEDFAADDPNREAWSCLFFRYVAQPPLPIQTIARHAGVDVRQVHRRIHLRGLPLLADRLRALEANIAAGQRGGASGGPNGGTNLRRSVGTFIGRDGLLDQLQGLLADAQLLSVVGPGGIGKTRLVEELARQRLTPDAFPHGMWFVDLAPIRDPHLVVPMVARTMGWQESAGIIAPDALATALAPKRLLLVLDNCEHLVEACASLAMAVMTACPAVRLVATSRLRLGVEGERTLIVPPLATPQEGDLTDPALLADVGSVALFVDQARTVHSGFVLSPSNARDVAAICIKVEGIPLAIRLAASRVRVLGVDDIRRQLNRSMHLLSRAAAGVGAHDRHPSLDAAIDWSHALLTPAAKALFARLAVFRSGWAVDAARAVCVGGPVADDDLLELLFDLAEHSLVHVDRNPRDTRMRFLEPIREFALDRLKDRKEARRIRDSHLACFLSLARAAEPALQSSEQVTWLDLLGREHDNIRAALQWALDGGSPDTGLELAAALWRFWYLRGFIREGHGWLIRLLAAAGDGGSPAARARGLYAAGTLATYQDDLDTACRDLEASVALARVIGDASLITQALTNLGSVHFSLSDFERARALYTEALASSRQRMASSTTATILGNLALVAMQQGDHESASAHLHESLHLARSLGDRSEMADCLYRLGVIAHHRNDGPSARRYYHESLAIHREIGDLRSAAFVEKELGYLASDEGDLECARQSIETSLACFRRLNNRWATADALVGIGHVHIELNDLPAARAALVESLAIASEIDHELGRALALNGLGWHDVRMGRLASARTALAEALQIGISLNAWHACARSLACLIELEAAAEHPEKVIALHAMLLRSPAGRSSRPSPRRMAEIDRLAREAIAALADAGATSVATESAARGAGMTLEQALTLVASEHAPATGIPADVGEAARGP